jgi:glutamyl-tRNA synthetase
VREARQKKGNYIAYDKHCSYLSDEEVKENLDKNTPFTVRLRVSDCEKSRESCYNTLHIDPL